ncbi:OmpA family protein [Salipiger marinus]|nr:MULTISPECIES: OmpA family protein [Salipiger]MCD1619860.1 OmpA family protein [Salipiger manganoxidans]MEB3418472.1 OmpA family protein [Salipiger manganoxidans]HBM59403.1 OmpA family protein [Citreicella sp.]HBS99558.1 OmpA family protein [Citreicella sp.]
MAKRITKAFRGACCAVALAALAATGATAPASADSSGMADPVISTQNTRTIIGERYIPGISISPDGCEIWVMDDGVEGYAVSRVTRDGRPVCRDINVCGTLNTDQYFATDSYKIYPQARARLEQFFRQANAFGYIIVGHTDARASHAYNERLSYNRANSVAAVANNIGSRVIDVRGYGEVYPVATNRTNEGMAQNRRVEILCVR